MAPARPFEHPITVRYLEVDQQGVVFNAWYLAYFDDAMTAFLNAHDASYDAVLAEGADVMLVRSEIDWKSGVGFGDDVRIRVEPDRLGTTSFTLRFTVLRAGEQTAVGRTTYVAVATDGSGKVPVPERLRRALAT